MLPGRLAARAARGWNMSQQPTVDDAAGEAAGDGMAAASGAANLEDPSVAARGRLGQLMRTVAARPRLLTLAGIALLVLIGQVSTVRDVPLAIAFAVYAVAGTVVLAGLGLQRLRPDPSYTQPLRRRRQFQVALVFLAAALLLSWVGRSVDSYLFAAIMLAVAALGQLLTEWRNSRAGKMWPFWLALCAGAYGLGLARLHDHANAAAGILIAFGVLAAPIGVTLVSEQLLRGRMRWPAPHGWSTYLTRREVLIGYVLAAVSFVVLVVMADSVRALPWIALGFAAAGLLLLAMATSWQADIAVVLLLIAAARFTTAGTVPLDESHGPDMNERVLVALGDSYISGEGSGSYFAGTNTKGGSECRRAPSAYMPQLINRPLLLGATDLVFLACSGARGFNLYDTAQGTVDTTPRNVDDGTDRTRLHQLAHLRRILTLEGLEVAALVLSIGGNDAGFSTIGMTCLTPGDCSRGLPAPLWSAELTFVAEKLDRAYWEVAATVEGRFPVVVVPYPTPLTRDGCDQTWLTAREHRFLYQYVEELNAVVRQTAARYQFNVAEPVVASLGTGPSRDPDGLRLCDTDDIDDAGINFVGVNSVAGHLEQRINPANWLHNSFHPNEDGHLRMADAMRGYLSGEGNRLLRPVVPEPQALPKPELTNRPIDQTPCASARPPKKGCDNTAGDWAAGQVADLLTRITVPISLGLVGLWLIALGVLSGWRANRLTPTAPPIQPGTDP